VTVADIPEIVRDYGTALKTSVELTTEAFIRAAVGQYGEEAGPVVKAAAASALALALGDMLESLRPTLAPDEWHAFRRRMLALVRHRHGPSARPS
jgi:hypothetical protein